MWDTAACHVGSRIVVIRAVPLYGHSSFSATLHTKVDTIAAFLMDCILLYPKLHVMLLALDPEPRHSRLLVSLTSDCSKTQI